MQNQMQRKGEAKRTWVLFALPLLVLGVVPASRSYKEHVKQRRTQALLKLAPTSSCDSWEGYSSARCHDSEIKWLIANGADVNARNAQGVPLIRLCVENGQRSMAHQLRRAGARPDTKTQRFFYSEDLSRAVEDQKLPLVRSLVVRGANVNFDDSDQANYDFDTPLNKAIYLKNVPLAKYLISKGARLSSQALFLALSWGGHPPMLRMLKEAGTPSTPTIEMFIAVIEDRPRDVEKYLRSGININTILGGDSQQSGTLTPLMWASAAGNARMVRLLLRHGADPNRQKRGDEGTALGIASTAWSSGARSSFPYSDFPQTIAILKRVTKRTS